MNEAQKLQQTLGVQSKEKRIQEMAGAVTRLVINEAIKEAKERAKVRDATLNPQPGDSTPKNG
jgi:ribosomal protein L12E/L44/L45/RPP1/RPP2